MYKKSCLYLLAIFLLGVSVKLSAQSMNHPFTSSSEGWVKGYAGYPVQAASSYELNVQWVSVPDNISSGAKGMLFSGKNYSKKLFLFIKKKYTNLQPNTAYKVVFNMDWLTNYPANKQEKIYVKVGAFTYEPFTIDTGFVRTNMEQGIIGENSKDFMVIGNLNNALNTDEYKTVNIHNYTKPFYVNTDKNGALWLVIALEPEAVDISNTYLTSLRILLRNDGHARNFSDIDPKELKLYPDPNAHIFSFKSGYDEALDMICIYTAEYHLLKVLDSDYVSNNKTFYFGDLPRGIYQLVFILKDGRTINKTISL